MQRMRIFGVWVLAAGLLLAMVCPVTAMSGMTRMSSMPNMPMSMPMGPGSHVCCVAVPHNAVMPVAVVAQALLPAPRNAVVPSAEPATRQSAAVRPTPLFKLTTSPLRV